MLEYIDPCRNYQRRPGGGCLNENVCKKNRLYPLPEGKTVKYIIGYPGVEITIIYTDGSQAFVHCYTHEKTMLIPPPPQR